MKRTGVAVGTAAWVVLASSTSVAQFVPSLEQCIARDLPPQKRAELCTSAIERATLSDSDRAHAHNARASAWAQLGAWPKALEDMDAVIRLSAPRATAFLARATVLRILGDHARAIQDLNSARDLDSEAGRQIYAFGQHLLYKQRDFASAAIYFNAVLAKEKENTDALKDRALAYHYTGRNSEAFADLSRALEMRKDWAPALVTRGIVNANIGNYDEALHDFHRTLDKTPDDGNAHYYRGHTLFRIGRFREAAEAFARSATLRPEHLYSSIWHHLAMERSGTRDVTHLESIAQRLQPGTWPGPIVELLRGRLDPNEAVTAAETNDELVARDRLCEAHFFVGQYFLLSGDRETAKLAFENAMSFGLTEFIEHITAEIELKRLGL